MRYNNIIMKNKNEFALVLTRTKIRELKELVERKNTHDVIIVSVHKIDKDQVSMDGLL